MEYTELINQLADKLAVPANKLLVILPRISVKDITFLVMSLLLVIAGIGFMAVGAYYKKLSKDRYDDFWCIPLTIGAILFCLFSIVSLLVAPTGFLAIIDPEAWALDYILGLIM